MWAWCSAGRSCHVHWKEACNDTALLIFVTRWMAKTNTYTSYQSHTKDYIPNLKELTFGRTTSLNTSMAMLGGGGFKKGIIKYPQCLLSSVFCLLPCYDFYFENSAMSARNNNILKVPHVHIKTTPYPLTNFTPLRCTARRFRVTGRF